MYIRPARNHRNGCRWRPFPVPRARRAGFPRPHARRGGRIDRGIRFGNSHRGLLSPGGMTKTSPGSISVVKGLAAMSGFSLAEDTRGLLFFGINRFLFLSPAISIIPSHQFFHTLPQGLVLSGQRLGFRPPGFVRRHARRGGLLRGGRKIGSGKVDKSGDVWQTKTSHMTGPALTDGVGKHINTARCVSFPLPSRRGKRLRAGLFFLTAPPLPHPQTWSQGGNPRPLRHEN